MEEKSFALNHPQQKHEILPNWLKNWALNYYNQSNVGQYILPIQYNLQVLVNLEESAAYYGSLRECNSPNHNWNALYKNPTQRIITHINAILNLNVIQNL